MRWVPDNTGRFSQRPHYPPNELDIECEKVIETFLRERYGKVAFPITTDDLTILIEENTEDFDSCADLNAEGDDVEGITYFAKGKKPKVCISEKLSNPIYQNRLRTTLTHELFHVLFHDFLFQTETPSLFSDKVETEIFKCKRDNIVGASVTDWMEWQAGYGCGAFLMPFSDFNSTVRDFRVLHKLDFQAITAQSKEGQDLISTISSLYQTSKDAARVRLIQQEVLI